MEVFGCMNRLEFSVLFGCSSAKRLRASLAFQDKSAASERASSAYVCNVA